MRGCFIIYKGLACLLLLFCVLICANASTKEHKSNSIIFQTFTYQPVAITMHPNGMISMGINLQSYSITSSAIQNSVLQEKIPVSTDDITRFVKQVRESICESIGDGQVRVWISAEAKAGIVVSGSANAGLEVIINCGTPKKKVT